MSLHTYNEEEGSLKNRRKRGKSDKPYLLKKYKITNLLVSKWFGYSSEKSFNNSTLKQDMLNGVESIIAHIENEIINKIK